MQDPWKPDEKYCPFKDQKKDKTFDCNDCTAIHGTYLSGTGKNMTGSHYVQEEIGKIHFNFTCIH